MDASRHGSFPRAHGFREGGPDASVRERVLRPLGSSRILPQRLTSPSPLPAGRSLRETRPTVAAGADLRRGETPRAPPRREREEALRRRLEEARWPRRRPRAPVAARGVSRVTGGRSLAPRERSAWA